MRPSFLLRSLALLAAAVFASPAHGQYGGSTYPMYYPSGPSGAVLAPGGSAGFEVPIERTGHSFSFNWRAAAGGAVSSTSAYPLGFVTSSGSGATAVVKSFLVSANTPSSYVSTPVTYTYPGYTYTSGGTTYTYPGYTYTSYTYTSVPFACVEWWITDTTASQQSDHRSYTPRQGLNENLCISPWTQTGGSPTRYFTISDSRLGHALVAGSPAGGWSPVTPGYYTFGTYSNGTTGTPVSLHWFTASAPVGTGDFSIADLTDGIRSPLNQANASGAQWVQDYAFYPNASVTFYLPAAEMNNLYVLHYQLPGQVAAAAALWPTVVSAALPTTTVNAGQKTIPAGAATVTGSVAIGATFWLTRNIDNYSSTSTNSSTPVFTLTPALANSTTPKRWWLSPPPAAATWDLVTFGIASTRAAQTFTVSQPSSNFPISPGPGSTGARPILTYQDYAANGSANSFNYFTVTALVNHAEPFNLVAQTGSAPEMFSQGQVWVLDGWTPIGGTAGTLPSGIPGQFNFSLTVAGPEPVAGLTLTAPSGAIFPLIPSAPSTLMLDDQWHAGTTWPTTKRTWTLAQAYTGLMGDWWLSNAATGQDWGLTLNVGNTTDYIRDLGYQAKVKPLVMSISLSRWAFDTVPRLRLRQRDGSDFPVAARVTTQYTSFASDLTAWNNATYLFVADTYARDGVDYWLYDEETGEESPYNTINLITWFALPTPAGLTGAINPETGSIDLQWALGPSPTEGGFVIERQLSGETTWQTIDTLQADKADPSDVLHFSDLNPVLGHDHTYRVRYTYGAGAALRRSSRSNLVVLTGWRDTFSGGIPDWWKILYGLDLSDPNVAGAPASSGGMSNLTKYNKGLNPNKTDTDGDGVDDVNDAYPTDNRRSQVLPVIRYVAVDISTAEIGTTDVWSAALDDSGQAAFVWNDAGRKEYESDVWRNGVVVQKLRLPFGHKPPSKLFTKTYPPEYDPPSVELLAVQTWWYEPKMVNASGTLGGSRFAEAQLYRKANPDANVSGIVPPDPNNPEYVIWFKTVNGYGTLNWPGGSRPDPSFREEHLDYPDLHEVLGMGITNSGTLWGGDGDSAYYGTFIGDTHFGIAANIRPFNFRIDTAAPTLSGNGNAVGVEYTADWTARPAAWRNTGGGFLTVFGGDTTASATYLGIDDLGEILGFSESFTAAAWFPHAGAPVLHAFWYTANAPEDFYRALPEGFGSHIAFTALPGIPLFSSNGDMMFSAQIADFDANGQKIWRDGTLLWDRQKQTLSEVDLPPAFALAGHRQMTNAHMMAGLQWKQDATGQPYRAAVLLLPFELNSDLNNDGKAGEGADSSLKTAGIEDTASDDAKEKGTEYLLVNDQLSNGLFDKEDTSATKPPTSHTDDDDLTELKTICAATWGAVWFEYEGGDVTKLAFYKSKECTAANKVIFPFALSETNKLPEKLWVRAEPDTAWTAQVEGKLLMKFGKADKSETYATDKLRFTVVKNIGDTKFFHATRDYIMENNTRFWAGYKVYGTGGSAKTVRMVVMREEAAKMQALDTYWRQPPLWGIDAVVGAYGSASVAINSNFTFDIQSIGIFKDITRRCHGRLVTGGALNTNVSSDNADPNNPGPTDPLRGSVYAGPEAKYIAMPQDYSFTIAKGRVPLSPMPKEALGGWHTDYNRGNQDQMVGIGKVDDQHRMVFTATVVAGSGVTASFVADAKKSGVPALPGGDSDDIMLILGDANTSNALAYKKADDVLTVTNKGAKHTWVGAAGAYTINTYLLFYCNKPRP